MSKFVLALDAGHGGDDNGAHGNGLFEKRITLDVVKRAKAYIDKYYPQIDCRLTRDSDRTTSLSYRTRTANGWGSDALVSVHVNSAEDHRANGFESFRYTTDDSSSKSYSLQEHLHNKLSHLWIGKNRRDRGKKRANFHMVREFKGASVLVELGFIVNDEDAKLLKNQSFLQQNAEALADAVAEYFGVTKSVTPKKEHVYRVIVNGDQVGAYAEPENISRQVKKAVRSGKSKVEIQLT